MSYIKNLMHDIGTCEICQIVIDEYSPRCEQDLREIVEAHNIEQIHILDDYQSPKLDALMEQLQQEGKSVVYDFHNDMKMAMQMN